MVNKARWWLFFLILLFFASVAGYQTVFTLPKQAQLSSIAEGQLKPSLQCYRNPSALSIDLDRQVSLLLWNIYKQNRVNWQSELDRFSEGKQLVLLQEASMTKALRQWIEDKQWFGSQVDAFKAFDTTAGVLNLSLPTPSLACAYTELEPWLGLPKSALYANYRLSNGEVLAVVNIHAVNFTYGTKEYQRQLSVLVDELLKHQGPIILAGDFNSWSDTRMAVMQQALDKLELQEAKFEPDNRTQFMTGLALDHVFYRHLVLETAEAPVSDASDHNPLEVRFRLEDKDVQSPN